MQEDEKEGAEQELSAVWQQLLHTNGNSLLPSDSTVQPPYGSEKDVNMPLLDSDPWNELLHVKGVEVFDLQEIHLHMSDRDVEQLLQIMQEQAPPE